MRAYSLDLRERIIAALEVGQTVAEVALRFAVSPRTVRRYRQQWRDAGSLVARTSPGRPPLIDPDQHAALTMLVLATPDATLTEYCQQWTAASGVSVSAATMCRTLQQLELTRKKSA
jgi:transposase